MRANPSLQERDALDPWVENSTPTKGGTGNRGEAYTKEGGGENFF